MAQTISAAGVSSSKNLCWQAWAKSATAQKFRFWLANKSATSVFSSTTLGDFVTGSTWQRYTWDVDSGGGAGNPVFRLSNASDALARTVVFGGVCVEEAAFPSSLILNDAAAINNKRYADVVTFTADQIPYRLRAGKWASGIRTKWANTDLVSGDTFVLLSFGDADNCLRVRHTGTDVRLEAVVAGAVVASSGAITVARNGYLTLVVDPAAGVLTVNGVAGATGTAWAWPGGVPMRVGGVVAAASEPFVAIKAPEAAA
jgi:hypothetical protein